MAAAMQVDAGRDVGAHAWLVSAGGRACNGCDCDCDAWAWAWAGL
jgi:hypothetical protein